MHAKEAVGTTAGKKAPGRINLKDPNMIMLIAGIVFVIILAIVVPKFLSVRNISNIFVTASTTGLMAIGLTFVMITSGIDLSCPTVMALSAICGASVMLNTGSVLLGVLVILAVGLLFGVINGLSVAKLRMVPMIVTLAVSTVASGISNWYTGARSLSGMPELYSDLFSSKLFGVIPVQAVILVAVTVIMHIVLTKTVFGRSVFAVGVNEKAARVNGVKTGRIIFFAYMIAGGLYGLAGVVAGARSNAAGPSLGQQSMFMDIVCAVVLGGTSVSGGKGSIVGTFVGCLFMSVISNVMNLMNVEYFVTYVIKGAIIVLVTYFDVIRNRSQESR